MPTASLVLVAVAFLSGAVISAGVLLVGLGRRSGVRWGLQPRRAVGLLRRALPIGAYFVVEPDSETNDFRSENFLPSSDWPWIQGESANLLPTVARS